MITVNPNFDTAAAVAALKDSGFKLSEASAIVDTIKLSQEHLATHSDISLLSASFETMLRKHSQIILGGVFSMLTIFVAILKMWPDK